MDGRMLASIARPEGGRHHSPGRAECVHTCSRHRFSCGPIRIGSGLGGAASVCAKMTRALTPALKRKRMAWATLALCEASHAAPTGHYLGRFRHTPLHSIPQAVLGERPICGSTRPSLDDLMDTLLACAEAPCYPVKSSTLSPQRSHGRVLSGIDLCVRKRMAEHE